MARSEDATHPTGSDLAGASADCSEQAAAGPFLCKANFPLDQHEALLASLAELQLELVRLLGIDFTSEPIELNLFADRASYQKHLTERFPHVPYRRALFVKSGGPGMVFAHRNRHFDVDVRHETTHALLHSALTSVPLWLDEGLAEYFEVPADQRLYDNTYLKDIKWNVRVGVVPTLASLERRNEMAEMGRLEYRYAWAWVHFMLHGPPGAHTELIRYLTDLKRNAVQPGLRNRLEARFPRLESHLVKHFRNWQRPETA